MNSNINSTGGSLLASLRALMPDRPLTFDEAKVIAERQAAHLLRTTFDSPPFRSQVIEQLPRLDVQVVPSLPGSGMSHWSKGRWRVRINGTEAPVRRRFTLAHEFKHVLDAPFEDVIYKGLKRSEDRDPLIEATCDHFAACLLMPKKWVKRYFGQGIQDPVALAWRFDVSGQAMAYRISQLGLVDPTPRCEGVALMRQNRRPPTRRYYRAAPSTAPAELVPA